MHKLSRTTAILLSLSTLARCSCEEEEFIPAVTYEPASNLVFGDVSVNSEKTIDLLAHSNGRAPFTIIAANIVTPSGDGTWRVKVDAELMEGLRPGTTASVAVTFRPCPAAWDGNTLRQDFDFNTCPGDPQTGDLNITDNSRAGSATFGLSGRPVQPPVATVFCPVSSNCGEASPQLRECNGVTFGAVSAGDPPCDLVMEIRNEFRNDKPVGTLEIERMEVLVQDFCCGDPGPITVGAEVGFEVQDMSGAVLNPDSGAPFTVPIMAGGTTGANRFKFVFDGSRTGIWRGQAANMTGLRLYTNDPDRRIISVPVTAQGSAPELACTPSQYNYGPVEQGTTQTATITCRNGGDADLVISNIAVANAEFVVRTDKGTTSNITLALFEQVIVWVDYTPTNTGNDAETLILTSNDPITPRTEITLKGGAVPEIDVQPSDVLVYPLDPMEMPPIPPKILPLGIANVGYGDLVVSRLELRGPNGALDHPSVDDFTVEGCAGMNPCNVNLRLCAPGTMGCMTFETTLDITYDNNDISTTDLVELHIFSDDPTDPEHIVVLQAQDIPCLFPTPVITVLTVPACVGAPVNLDASSSNVGSPGATITSCDWFWAFTPGAAPPFNTMGTITNAFVPPVDGTYYLGLHCTNSCGAMSQTPGQETILVSDQCN
jgi:hypothetical protein